MVTNSLLRNDLEAQRQVAEEIARGLAYADIQGTDVVVQTPIAFPGGRRVGIKLLGGPATFTITDDGATMREADLMGAADICRREARKIAKEYDLKFNEWELFEAEAPADRLVGYTVIVANAAALTMMRTADRFSERFAQRHREALAVRLQRVFGAGRVVQNAEVAGASAKVWNFDARVELPSGRPGLFSIVTPAPISVAFAYSKIDDVSRDEPTPFLGAVLDGAFDPSDAALLRRAARKVFSLSDPDDAFRQAA